MFTFYGSIIIRYYCDIGIDLSFSDSRKKSLPEGNIKSLLFGEAARKLQKDFKTIPPHPFVSLDSPTLLTNYMGKPNNPTFEFRVKIWDNFSFDIQAILKALK